jgi:hypothetical protein
LALAKRTGSGLDTFVRAPITSGWSNTLKARTSGYARKSSSFKGRAVLDDIRDFRQICAFDNAILQRAVADWAVRTKSLNQRDRPSSSRSMKLTIVALGGFCQILPRTLSAPILGVRNHYLFDSHISSTVPNLRRTGLRLRWVLCRLCLVDKKAAEFVEEVVNR